MTAFHSVFGLHLYSNLAIPGLPPAPAPNDAPDVELHFGVDPQASGQIVAGPEDLTYVSPYTGIHGEPALRIWKLAGGKLLRMEYCDGVKFWLDRQGTQVWSAWNQPLLLEDVATYVLGPVLGLLLRLRGVTCLHASAIALDDFAVAFVGSEGSGKSTTAAALARRNHPVISDDIVALAEDGDRFLVFPAYPYLSLWLESAEILLGRDAALPVFSPNYNKRRLLLEENRLAFATRPLPLGAIYLLAERTAEERAPFVESLPPSQSMLRLVADSYATNLLNSEMRAREFALLGRLLVAVPVYLLHPHQDSGRIGRLCELIECYFRQLDLRSPSPESH